MIPLRQTIPVMIALVCSLATLVQAQSPFYSDTGSPENPDWSTILPTLNVGTADPGPVSGSVITVNNAATEVGLFGGRPLSVPTQRIHVCCNTSTADFPNFTRWFQTDGNTQVFRLFVNDENTASDRTGTARTEAFTGPTGWNIADNRTYEWTGRYTIARRQQGYAIFQSKNDDNDWAVQLNITSSGSLLVNNRRNAVDVFVTNPDGSNKDFDGLGFDARVLDDGLNYKVWIDGVLYADNYYSRPTSDTKFRWGMYLGSNTLVPPSDNTVILVSGAQVKSWPGILTTTTTPIVKANNTSSLGNTASWTGAVLPGIHNQAVWDSTVTAANTPTLNVDQTWGGVRITDPGGAVTINGTALLGLDESGVDMSATTRNLTVNCPVELRVTAPWTIAPTFSATVNGGLRGYGGLTLSGGGTLLLTGANTFTGPVNINQGALRINQSAALGTGSKSVKINTGTSGNPQLRLDGSGGSIVVPSSITYLTSNDVNGAIVNEAGNNTIAGAITLTGGGGNTRIYCNAGTLTLGGPINSSNISRTLRLMGAGSGNVTGNISNGSAAFVVTVSKEESGTWTLGGNNAHGGATNVVAGTLVLVHPSALGTGGMTAGVSTGGTSLTAGAVLDLNGQQGINEVITVRGTGISSGGALINGSATTASIAGGRVASISTTAGGTHSSVPAVTLGGGGGSGATAIATLSVRAASFIIDGGTTVYSTAPTVSISGGGGSGATATAVLTSGVVTGITITNGGAGYTSAPSITFSGGTITTAGVNPTGIGNDDNFLVSGFQVTNPGSGYTSAPAVTFSSGTGTMATANLSAVILGASSSIGGSGSILITPGISGAFALTKVGTGAVTLGGASTYTGATAINAGTLILGANHVLPDTTAVSIAAATLDADTRADIAGTLDITAAATIRLGSGAALAFADSSAVDWTGGTLAITGTFVSGSSLRFGTSSSALTASQLSRIAKPGGGAVALNASGYLIDAPVSGYASWAATNAPGNTPTQDYDDDGVSNGVEYVLGGTVLTDDLSKLPAVSTSGGNILFTFQRAQSSINAATALSIQVGTTLLTWPGSYIVGADTATSSAGVTVLKGVPAGFDTVTISVPQSPDLQKFIRLNVTLTP